MKIFVVALLSLSYISACTYALSWQEPLTNSVVPQSERVKNTINSIEQAFDDNQKHGYFIDANLRLRNGYVNFTYAVSDIELKMIDEFDAAQKLLTDKPTAALAAIRRANEVAQNSIYDQGSKIFETLGEAMILSNGNTKRALRGASQMLQQIGSEVLNQMNVFMSISYQGINIGGAPAKQAITAARYAIEGIFATGYDVLRLSHQQAAIALAEAATESAPSYEPVVNQYAQLGASDPDTAAALSEITNASEDALQSGAESGKVYRLKELLISSVCDFAKLTVDARDFLARAQALADADPSSAKDIFLNEAEDTGRKVHEVIGDVMLELSGLGLNADDSKKRQIDNAVKSMEHGIVEFFTGSRSSVDLTIHSLGLPVNIRCYVLRAAVESGRYGKLALLQRITGAAKIVFLAL